MLLSPLDGEGPLHRQLYRSLRGAILAGRLTAGARLPSTRSLARELGLARNTVLFACEQLVAEGYAAPRARSGTFVADALPLPAATSAKGAGAAKRADAQSLEPRLSETGRRLGEIVDYRILSPLEVL